MNARRLFLLAAGLLAVALPAAAYDWPQWRGPNRDDVSHETGLLTSWPKEGPKLLWTFREAGAGYSGPAVVGDRLYCLGADDRSDTIYALDVQNGKRLWSTPIAPESVLDRGDGPRCNPTVDGDRLYAIGGQGELVCADTSNGALRWHLNLKKDLGGEMMSGWGYSESPLVDGDQVVCTPGGSQGSLAALNKKTGEVIWRSQGLKDKAAYSSIVAAEIGGVRQYVQQTGNAVVGVAAKDGKLLWRYVPGNYRTAVIPTPIVHGDDVFASAGYGAGCTLLHINAADGQFKAEKVYANKDMVNHHGGVVLVGDHLYGYSDGKGWVCMNFKTGEVVWSSKDLDKGSLTCADGHLYCYGEDSGKVVLADASPSGWKADGSFTVPEKSHIRKRGGTKFWTHPVVANGRLYVRDQDLLFCYDVKAGQQ